MARPIEGASVAIVGASSGIGRATDPGFARRGANVVVAARREDLLADVAWKCERLGGRAIAVATDVTDAAAVHHLADTASKFGLRGFNASLRQQFAAHEDIHVCGVFPATVDTPGLEHVANDSIRSLIDPSVARSALHVDRTGLNAVSPHRP